MSAAESTVVYADHIARIVSVRTIAVDEWRAAIALHGELDIANAEGLRAELMGHLDAGRRVLRVDASGVDFMDSTAIGVLVAVNARCREEHGSLILTGLRRPLLRLLKIAGLDQVLLVDTAGSH